MRTKFSVHTAVAKALRPEPGYGLGAHRILIDLASSRSGVTRIVTTNFDLLFEECDSSLLSSGPPHLPVRSALRFKSRAVLEFSMHASCESSHAQYVDLHGNR